MTASYWAAVVDQGKAARIERASHDSISVQTLKPGEYVVVFPNDVRSAGCTATLNNSVGFITAVPGDRSGLPANGVRVLTMSPSNVLEARDFTIVALPEEVSRKGYPSRDAYSSQFQRGVWTERLKIESENDIRVAYHPMGQLAGLSGSFPIAGGTPADVAGWFRAHSDMLGLETDAELTVVGEEPFYEMHPDAARRARQAAESPSSRKRARIFDKRAERHVGTVYAFEVSCKGYPFTGMRLSGIASKDRPVLHGVYNGYSPAVHGFKEVVVSPEDRAWQAAEKAVGTAVTRLSQVLTWFDMSWAANRIPSAKELHWRLELLDADSQLRYVFVRSSDEKVVYATPNTTSFGVHQTHMNDATDVLWDSVNLSNGCSTVSSFCSGPALDQSTKSRLTLPKVVDLWYRLSSLAPPPFVWPFSGLNKAPLDNRGRRIWAVLAHNGSKYSTPTRDGNTYYFPADPNTYPSDTVDADYFGHEYGHVILNELKLVHQGGRPFDENGNPLPAATFTESMCDFIGIVTEGVLFSELNQGFTDFQIGRTRWYQTEVGWKYDPAPVSWPLRPNQNIIGADRFGKGRDVIGRAFYNSWKWVEWWYGDRPRALRDENFRAWWVDIMRSFALVSDFPDIVDFYAATISRLGTYVFKEAGVSYRLAYELENLVLDQGAY